MAVTVAVAVGGGGGRSRHGGGAAPGGHHVQGVPRGRRADREGRVPEGVHPEGGGGGEVTGGQLAISAGDAATSARLDRRRRRRVSTRFTMRTLSPAISVNAFFLFLYRSFLLVIFVAFLLDEIKLFRCVGSFWLGGIFVRYLS